MIVGFSLPSQQLYSRVNNQRSYRVTVGAGIDRPQSVVAVINVGADANPPAREW